MLGLDLVRTIAVVALVAGCTANPRPAESVAAAASSTFGFGATASPGLTPIATASAVASRPPSSTEPQTAWAQDPPEPLFLDGAVRVLVPELSIRNGPSISAARLRTVTPKHILAVRNLPPIEADGYIWYLTAVVSASGALPPLPESPFAGVQEDSGWFAAMKASGGTRYVEPLPARCVPPENASLPIIAGMLGAERLTCFGGKSIELTGTYGCPGCNPEFFGQFDPDWLANPNIVTFLSAHRFASAGAIVKFPPAISQRPADGSVVRVRGHFDDPAAARCSVAIDNPLTDDIDPANPTPAAFARLWCRQMFVVERYEVVGVDPSFPAP